MFFDVFADSKVAAVFSPRRMAGRSTGNGRTELNAAEGKTL
jgi:hypothetical protein